MIEQSDRYNIPNEFIDNDEFYLHEASEHASSIEAARDLIRSTSQAGVTELTGENARSPEAVNLKGAQNASQLIVEMRNYYLDGHIAA